MKESFGSIQARNVASVRKMYEAERRKDIESWAKLWHPEGRQTYAFGGFAEVVGITALKASTAHKFATRQNVIVDDEVQAMADAATVFSRLRVRMSIGDLGFDTTVWCIFKFDPAGLILECEEALDTAYVMSVAAPKA